MPNRTFTDEERVHAVLAVQSNGGNVKATARRLGIAPATLSKWMKENRFNQLECAEKKRPDMVTALRQLAEKLLDAAADKIEGAPLNHVMTAYGIAIDKAQLLEGRPTEITQASVAVDLGRLTDEELATLERIASRATEPGGNSKGVEPSEPAAVHDGDNAGLSAGVASPGSVSEAGPVRAGGTEAADGVHAAATRKE